MDLVQKKYQRIDERTVLFNEEYYLRVLRVRIDTWDAAAKEELFTHLYAFESADIEMEIDISEEEKGHWYLQLLVPHVLTLPETAAKRLTRGETQLEEHLAGQLAAELVTPLTEAELYPYIKRYNPHLDVTA
ncbi:hypothetical protein KDJ56_05945 [Brevibacillus composti]|uniref:Uncharacterized protein n=1 Tax=Brevibacillus composti TaxID=2796470 RepID=A0A7T5JPQ1_9BACL|nr:hypothetical protein [Brevibacillus composti]QQE75509.1 hypothetical protein JD108_06265 [Brevibacillus composti]QUO42535.1 hypothetical protein KDJ56_05945 [Brevibacillus composti]